MDPISNLAGRKAGEPGARPDVEDAARHPARSPANDDIRHGLSPESGLYYPTFVSTTFERIQHLILAGEVRVSSHGYDQLSEDDILARDAVEGVGDARYLGHTEGQGISRRPGDCVSP